MIIAHYDLFIRYVLSHGSCSIHNVTCTFIVGFISKSDLCQSFKIHVIIKLVQHRNVIMKHPKIPLQTPLPVDKCHPKCNPSQRVGTKTLMYA